MIFKRRLIFQENRQVENIVYETQRALSGPSDSLSHNQKEGQTDTDLCMYLATFCQLKSEHNGTGRTHSVIYLDDDSFVFSLISSKKVIEAL